MKLTLFIIILYASFIAGSLVIWQSRPSKNFPLMTAVVFGITTILGVLQILFPVILAVLGREPQKFISGEWWRLTTPLFIQDGGIVGLLSNLYFLGILGYSVERIFTRKEWLVLYFGTGILTESVAYFWRLQGAGNSIANVGLASGLLMSAAFQGNILIRIMGIIGIFLGMILGILGDLHGVASILGTLVAFILRYRERIETSVD